MTIKYEGYVYKRRIHSQRKFPFVRISADLVNIEGTVKNGTKEFRLGEKISASVKLDDITRSDQTASTVRFEEFTTGTEYVDSNPGMPEPGDTPQIKQQCYPLSDANQSIDIFTVGNNQHRNSVKLTSLTAIRTNSPFNIQ